MAELCLVTSVDSFGNFVAAVPMLLQRPFLIEVFPALALPCADMRQPHKDRIVALESAPRDISRRRINGWPDRHTHAPKGAGGPRGGDVLVGRRSARSAGDRRGGVEPGADMSGLNRIRYWYRLLRAVGSRARRWTPRGGGGWSPGAVCRDEYNVGTATGNCHFFHRGVAYQPPNWISIWRASSTWGDAESDLTGGSLKPVNALADCHQWIHRARACNHKGADVSF